MHDYDLSARLPSEVAIGALYVALKICEQLKRKTLLTTEITIKMREVARLSES
jgi:hypothetical protein